MANMGFADLHKFAARVAQELASRNVPTEKSGADFKGWLLDDLSMEETTLSGGGVNTELQFVNHQLWLVPEGTVVLVIVKEYVVMGRHDRGSNRSQYYSQESLTEQYARLRDGRARWSRDARRGAGGFVRQEEKRFFEAPANDKPPFVSISAMLSRARKR